jgi:hypothetical protein
MDQLYDILLQTDYLPAKNKSSPRKDDGFCRFHEEMRQH